MRTTRETGRYEPVIEFMLRSFKETAEQTLEIVESIRTLLAQYSDERYLRTVKGQLEPLQNTVNVIFKKVYVRVKDLVDLGIHRQTAAVYLDRFVDQGLLSKTRVGRDNIYKNHQSHLHPRWVKKCSRFCGSRGFYAAKAALQ